MSDVRPFFGCETHENSGKLYESAVLREKAIFDSPDLYHIWSSVTSVLPVILLIREAPSADDFHKRIPSTPRPIHTLGLDLFTMRNSLTAPLTHENA